MPSRVNLPGAAELFRSTQPIESSAPTELLVSADGVATGRVRHDDKITVYVSADELLALEDARLALRRRGIAVDRGRIVRAALAQCLTDFTERGDESDLVAQLETK